MRTTNDKDRGHAENSVAPKQVGINEFAFLFNAYGEIELV